MSVFARLSSQIHYERVASVVGHPEQIILDVGCGTGETLQEHLPAGTARVVGIERLTSVALIASRQMLVVVGDLDQDWCLRDGSVDVISANQVVEHMIEPDTFVAEAFRVLRRGGWAVVSTENLASWPNIAALVFGQEPFSTNFSKKHFGIGNRFSRRQRKPVGSIIPHYSVPSFSALRHLFELAGFTYAGAEGVHVLPVPLGVVRKLTHFDTLHSFYVTLRFRKPERE